METAEHWISHLMENGRYDCDWSLKFVGRPSNGRPKMAHFWCWFRYLALFPFRYLVLFPVPKEKWNSASPTTPLQRKINKHEHKMQKIVSQEAGCSWQKRHIYYHKWYLCLPGHGSPEKKYTSGFFVKISLCCDIQPFDTLKPFWTL